MNEKIKTLPQNLTLSVDNYLLAKARYEVLNEKVEAVYAQIFSEPQFKIYNDMRVRHDPKTPKTQITESKKMYLSEDEETCRAIYNEADKRLKEMGIKPLEMETDYCPALVANSELNEAQKTLINAMAQFLDQPENFFDLLIRDFDKFNKFVDLSIKMVLAHPDYTPPKL